MPRWFRATAPLMHVIITVFVFFLLMSSWWMMALPLPSDIFTYRAFPFQLHKNVGLTLVVLVLVMLYARVAFLSALRKAGAVVPKMPASAKAQNLILYSLLLTCSISGYLSSSYSGWGTRLWWLVDLPNWGYDNDELNILYSDIHMWTYYGLTIIVAVHVGVAVYRGFRNEGIVRRILHL